MKKMLMAALAVVLIVVISASATFAYLTSQDTVVNTFTVGQVKIELDEAKVDEYGVAVEGAKRVKANEYKLLPGHKYVKDPTVTVLKGSEKSYVRILVSVNDMSKLTKAFPQDKFPTFYGENNLFLLQNLVEGWDGSKWEVAGYEDGTYEFRYFEIVDARAREDAVKLPALFTHVVMPGEIDNTAVAALGGVTITAVAQAVQADGFANADAAWAAAKDQLTTPPATSPTT